MTGAVREPHHKDVVPPDQHDWVFLSGLQLFCETLNRTSNVEQDVFAIELERESPRLGIRAQEGRGCARNCGEGLEVAPVGIVFDREVQRFAS